MLQKKMSKRLKLITLLLAVMGGAFFVGKMIYSYYFFREVSMFQVGEIIIATVYIASLYFAVLYQFYHVCQQIGEDNSFSLENEHSFYIMRQLGIAAAIGYVVRAIISYVIGIPAMATIVLGILFFLAVIFAILCECLSKLIHNAYEVKTENDLTI